MESTTSTSATPGKNDSHHAVVMCARPSAIMAPQEGVGGGIPAPRKLREASTMITQPTWSVASTTSGLTMLGKMWRWRMRNDEQPATRARATNSRSFQVRTSPRTSRANLAHITRPRTRIRFRKLGPNTTAKSSAMSMMGSDSMASVVRMIRVSTQRPK